MLNSPRVVRGSSWLMVDAEQTCVVVSVYNTSPDIFSMITEKATVVVLNPVLSITSDGADISYQTIQVRCRIDQTCFAQTQYTCPTKQVTANPNPNHSARDPLCNEQVTDPNLFLRIPGFQASNLRIF